MRLGGESGPHAVGQALGTSSPSRSASDAYCISPYGLFPRCVCCAGKSRKQLMNDWALDNDEDSGFDLNKFPLLPASALQKAGTTPTPGKGKSARR